MKEQRMFRRKTRKESQRGAQPETSRSVAARARVPKRVERILLPAQRNPARPERAPGRARRRPWREGA